MLSEITRDVVIKLLDVVDAGLSNGVGEPIPGQMCVEAAVCYALGLPHGDDPKCVAPSLRSLKIRLNDSNWSSRAARAKGLRRLAVVQLGSKGNLDEKEFATRCAVLATKTSVPIALRAAASIHNDPKHAQALRDAANRCEIEGTRKSAVDAREVAREARRAADAYAAAYAYADADAAAYAAAYAYADAAAAAAADAYAYADADAAAAAAAAAYAAAYAYADAAAAAAADAYAAAYAYADAAAAAYAAAYAYAYAYAAAAAAADADADAAAYADADADAAADARDKSLADFAEGVVQILIEMKVPGVQWLELTEAIAA